MVGGGQIGNVEQEGERDRCVENELSLVSHSSLSLSLSPLFQSVKCGLKVKQLMKWFYGVRRGILWSKCKTFSV